MSRTTSRGTATVRQLCAAFRISCQAYYAAGAEARHPSPALVGPAVRPARSSVSAGELETAIRRVVEQHRAWVVRKVWATLRRQDLCVSRKRVWAMMRALGLVLPAGERRETPRFCHVATDQSNRRWATDLTTVWTRDDGLVAIVPVLDCGDRSVLDCEVTKSQESAAVLAPLARAVERDSETRRQCPRVWSCAPTTDRSTPAATARRYASVGGLTIPLPRWVGLPATPWPNASSSL